MSKQLKKKLLCELGNFRLQSTMFQPIFVPVGFADKSLRNARNSASPRPTLNSFKSDFPFFPIELALLELKMKGNNVTYYSA